MGRRRGFTAIFQQSSERGGPIGIYSLERRQSHFHTMANTAQTRTARLEEEVMGKTLPELLYRACRRYENDRAFNQRANEGWRPLSLLEFKESTEEIALGLYDLSLAQGDRVGLFMQSDVYFCLADMGCLVAGLVDVPVYVTHTDDVVRYVLDHAEIRALIVSTTEDLDRLQPILRQLSRLETVIVAETQTARSHDTHGARVMSLNDLRELGRGAVARGGPTAEELHSRVRPDDLATIIYTSGTTGRPKGVMLSHQNISSNALMAFSELHDYRPGSAGEVVLSFLPLTHIFARTLQYGHMAHGTSVYYSDPDNLTVDLKQVSPTIFATVPRVLEKVYTKIRERAALMKGIKRKLLYWALAVAHEYDVLQPPSGFGAIRLRLADRLVYRKWREALGGRVKYIISGGAALNADLANVFAAARVIVLQGYGLTETSPIISFNRPDRNRPDTVGLLLPAVEVKIADDGEILTRGPHVMQGYFKDPERTNEVIDSDGWLHTGDIGELSDDGFLRLTDRKKDLFKLSTGKYVMPQPLESRLTAEPLVEQAVVVGTGYKFCSALIFPDQDVLKNFGRSRRLDPMLSVHELLAHPTVIARFERIVEKANRGMEPWSTIKHFALVPERLTVESGLLTPTMKVRRAAIHDKYAPLIALVYERASDERGDDGDDPSRESEAVVI